MTAKENQKKNLEKLEQLRIMDDTFARTYFRKHPELAEFVLKIITGFKDISIDKNLYETQYDANRFLDSRSLVFDVFAGDTTGRRYNFEVENRDASPERAEVHVAAMVQENLHSGDDFSDLPEIYVIFICDHDYVGNGRAVNEFVYMNTDRYAGGDDDASGATHESMNGRTHVIFVNGDYDDETTDIGKLVHDFKCKKADDMFFPNLAERVRYLKEDEKGVGEMCKVMEELRQETIIENSREIAKKMLLDGKLSHEDISAYTGLTLEEVKALAGQAAS